MKKNIFLVIFTTFLLTLISVAYAAFNSEVTISSSGIVEKDTTPPTCGSWYLRDSNLTIQEAYDQNKFTNPGTNTTWTTSNQKLFIECSDNMPGDYGCINVTTITDNNNNPRYFKEVKEYTTSITTDPNAVTVTLKDAYENEKTCTLPVGGSNPYIDKQEPTITITPTSYNKFTYSATDDIGVTGYQVTTNSTEPTTWLTTPAEVTIDNTAAKTYYVWAKDGVNVSYQTIKTFKLTKTQGTGTTLTLKYNNNSGATLSTGYVLDGTKVYVTGSANAGYNTVVLKKDSTTISSGSTQTITAATTISSTATANTYTATFYYNSNTTSGSMTISSVSETCTITGSNTSCNVTIPSAVTDSVGKYNSEYLGVSASLNNLTSAGTTSVSINEDKTFYAFYSSPVTIYYPSATVDGTTGALSNTSVGHYDYYRNEFITNITSGSEAMSAVLNSTQTANSNFTFTPSATGYTLRGFAKVANSTTRTYSSVAVAAASDSSEIYAFIRKGLTATVYYNAGSGDGTLTVATATTTTAYRTMYCGTTTTIKMSNANYAIPTAVSTSVGQYGTKILNLSQALNSMTGNRYTSSSSSATGADTKVLYAIYQGNDVEGTKTNVTNYYFNGTSYISRTLYRNSFFTSVSDGGAMTTVLSTSTTGKTNYSTAVGPGNSVWSGLSNAQDTTAEHDSVAAAAISKDLSLYTVYTMNITYAKGSNVSAIEKNSDSCKLTTDSTSCDVTLPTITPNAGYNSVGWSATNGDTTGVTGTYNNTSNTTKLYANAKANTYTIAYAMNNGSDPNPKPTSGTYDSNLSIGTTSMPTKTVTITGDANGTGATVGSATVNTQTFAGWISNSNNGLQGNAQSGSTTSNFAAWTGTATTNKFFKNLRTNSGTVTLTATWSGSSTLPTVTKAGYTCSWYDTNGTTGGNLIGDSGGSYTVPSNSATTMTIYARCTPNTYTVTADANGGSIASTTGWTGTGNTSTKSVTYDAAYGTLPTVSKTGYTLAGWNGKNLFNESKYLNIEDYTIDSNSYYWAEIKLKPNTIYKVSVIRNNDFDGKSQTVLLALKKSPGQDGKWTAISHLTAPNTSNADVPFQYTTDDDGLLYIGIIKTMLQTNLDTIWENTDVQIEEGTITTPYEPYYITPETLVTTPSDHNINAVWVDDTAPVLVSATPSSTWDVENYIDFNATDAGSGIVGYNITTTTTAPTNWIPVVDTVETGTETKYELDAAWARVFHHNTHWGSIMYSNANSWAEAKSSNTVDKYSVLENLENYKNVDTWEFLLQYPQYNPTGYNRWSQTSNPATTSQTVSNYTKIGTQSFTSYFNGLQISGDTAYTFIDGTAGGSGNWWFPIGAGRVYQGALPGPYPSVSSVVNLWSRIDNLTTTTSSNLSRRIGDIKENGTYYVWVVDDSGNTAYTPVTISKVDTTAPTGTVTSTNDVASSQTVTLSMSDNVGVTSYLWNTSYTTNWTSLTSSTTQTITKTVDTAGTYYLGIQDAAGNGGRKIVTKDFYNTYFVTNGGAVSPAKVITMNGNSFVLPTPSALTGYTWGGWYTDEELTTPVTLTSGAYKPTANKTLYGKWTANTYTIAYTMNNGSNPNPKPTSGTYDSDVVIGSTSMPTKTITITGNANNTGATVGSATINSMTFNGWTTSSSAGLGSGAKTGTEASPSTAWNGSATTNKYFKNLRDTSGTVTLTANWSTSVTLPTLTDPAGYTCKYYTDATAGTEMGSGGATYTVANNSPTSITAFVKCTAKPLVFDDQTITKTFSTSSQSANVTPASNGTGSYTYSKVSGESDITVSSSGEITIPASKAANTTGYNVVIRATDSNSGATADATYTIKINQAECKLAVSNPANKNPDDTYDLSTLVTANAGTVTYALKSGGSNTTTPSTLSGSTLTIGAMSSSNDTNQSVDVQFTDPGSNDYEGCTIEKSVTVKKKTNTLAANNSTVYVNSTTALSTFIKNNNGGTVTYTKGTDNTSGSSISGSNFVAGTLAANDDANKTVTITATSARTTKVAASGNVNITVTVQKYTRGLTLTIDPVNVKYNHTANLSTSNTGSGGTPSTTVTYASSNTNVFTVTGSTIKAVSYTGSSDITATRAGSTTVKAATATATATASQSDCLLTVSNSSMTTGSDIDLTTLTSNAVGNVTFAIKTNGTTTASTLSGSTLTAGAMSTSNDNAQTVVVTATEAATDYYTSCSKDITLTVNKQTNTLAANNKTVYVSSSTALSSLTKNNNGGTLSATITTDNTEGSSISGSNLVAGVLAANNDSNKTVVMTVTSARTASVAQKSVTVTATVQKYTRALTITTPSANQEVEYNKTITAASTNGGSGGTPGTVTYSSSNTSVFTVNGTTIKAVGTNGQTATIGASRAGTTTVKAATATAVTVTVIKNQTCQMAVSNPASKNPGNSYDLSTLVSGATGTVTYALKSGGNNTTTPSTLSGSTLTIGEMSAEIDNDQTVDIQITDAGSNRYVGCTIEKSVTVQKYTRTLAWSSSTPASNASLAYGTSYTASATASGSGGTAGSISYSSNNTTGATINSSTGVITVTGVSQNVTITASLAGTTTVKAASITRAYTTAKGTCPAPTNVAITNAGVVTWTAASGASSYQISMNSTSGFTAASSGVNYNNSITSATGSRTVYVRSVCDTTYYSSANSSNASKSTTVFSLTLAKGTGISEVSGAGNYITGASASINATVSAGYTWTNWTGSSTITNKSTSVTVNSNKSYTANAAPNTYTINYDKNAEDAVGIMAGQIMTYGQSTNLTLNNYSRSGYEFAGWNTDASGTGTDYTDGQSVSNLVTSGTITLYAKWTKKIYTISYTLNGGTVETANPTVYEIESPLITLNNPAKTGYTFTEWTEKTTDLDWYKGFINLSTGAIENSSNYPNSYYTDFIYLKAGVTYTISGGPSNLRWRKWNIDGTTYEGNASSATSYTPNANCYVRILFYDNPTASQMTNAVITNNATSTATIPTGSTGNKTFIANYTIDNPAAPSLSGNATRVYNYTGRTLTCSTTSTYVSGTNIYYEFGYATSTANWTADSITWLGSPSTTNTYVVEKNAYIGTRYYGCRVYASDGTSTSGTVKIATPKEQSFVNARVYFNVTENGGTISGSQRLYTPYGLTNIYTGRTNQTAGTIPTATKTGYTFTGWYTASTDGSLVINSSKVVQASVSGWTDGSKNWLRNSTANNDTTNVLYAQFTPNELIFNDKIITGLTYDSTNDQTVTNGVDEATNGTGTYTYTIISGNSDNYFSLSERDIVVAANTPANTSGYTITIRASDDNSGVYKDADYLIIVSKAPNTLAVTNATVYAGSSENNLSSNVSGAIGTVSYAKGTDNTQNSESSVNASSGSFTAGVLAANDDSNKTVTVAVTAAGNSNYESATKNITVTVQKYTRALTITSPTSGQEVAYNTSITAASTNGGSGGTPGIVTYSSSNTSVFTVSGTTITAVAGSGTATINASRAGSTTVKAATATGVSISAAKATCPAPTSVTIGSDKKVSWTNATGANSYQISMNASSGFAAHTNGAVYNSITDATGTRTVYVRSVCDTNYYSQYSSNASGSTTVYSVSLTAGAGISAVSGGGNYVTGATVSIDATVKTGYEWSKWIQTSGGTQVSTSKSYSATISTNWAYTATATYTASPTLTRNDYNTFTASETSAVSYFISKTQTTKPSANASGWSTTASKDVSTTAKETWYVWIKDASGNVSSGYSTITNYKVSLTAYAGTSITAVADSASGTNVASNSYVLANTPVYPTGQLATGYNTLVIKKGNTTITNGSSQTITADTTFSSSATPNTYTVNFNKNDSAATGSMSAQILTYDAQSALIPNAFTKTGYVFDSWNTAANGSGTSYANEQSVPPNLASSGSITLYAQWKIAIFTITLDNQSATTAGTASIYEKYNTGYYLTKGSGTVSNQMTTSTNPITVPTRTGYSFEGYYTAANGGGTKYIGSDGYITTSASNTHFNTDGTLYAKWVDNVDPVVSLVVTPGKGSFSLSLTAQDPTSGIASIAYHYQKCGGSEVTFNAGQNGSDSFTVNTKQQITLNAVAPSTTTCLSTGWGEYIAWVVVTDAAGNSTTAYAVVDNEDYPTTGYNAGYTNGKFKLLPPDAEHVPVTIDPTFSSCTTVECALDELKIKYGLTN